MTATMPETFQSIPTTWTEVEQNFAQTLPGYEPRQPQQIMAHAIEQALADGQHALVQAGCGTGKSLGGTVPALLQAIQQDTRVIVATATKALQEQYANKDIPFLQEKSGIVKKDGTPFTWALVKGRSNYACLAKLKGDDNERNPYAQAALAELEADEEHSGDAEHFQTEIPSVEWSKLASSSNECPGKSECPFGEVCYAEKVKARGKEVDLVITNQAMLMTDLVIREKTEGSDNGPVAMLGDYGMVLFDEGHELPEYAANALGNDFSGRGMGLLARDCATFAAICGEDLQHRTDKMAEVLQGLGGLLLPLCKGRYGWETRALTLSWFVENYGLFADMMDLLKSLRLDVQGLKAEGSDKAQAKKKMLLTRLTNAMETLEEMLLSEDADRVRWVEAYTDKRDEDHWKIRVAPVNVGPWLKRNLWDKTPSVVMSATLSAGKDRNGNKDFGYIQRTLGLYEADKVDVGTPFDFGQQGLMYVPAPSAPTPKDRSAWMTQTIIDTLKLIDASKGGALLLFTSRKAMQESFETLQESLENRGLTTLMQGDGRTNKELAQIFKEDEHSVLFALKSFFVGVDVPGEACRLVVIDKLPFPVPTDPIVAARTLAEERAGRRPFSSLVIPMMTLTLEQGVGRLIRTKSDRGVVAIMDSRLSSTPYGRSIVSSLPDFPVTTQMRDVEDFYAGKSFGR